MQLKRATEEEVYAVAQRLDYASELMVPLLAARLFKLLRKEEVEDRRILLDKGRAVGFLIFSEDPSCSTFIVKHMCVDVSLRRKTIGSRLLKWAKDRAAKKGCRRVGLDTLPATVPFFEKNGFALDGAGEVFKGMVLTQN